MTEISAESSNRVAWRSGALTARWQTAHIIFNLMHGTVPTNCLIDAAESTGQGSSAPIISSISRNNRSHHNSVVSTGSLAHILFSLSLPSPAHSVSVILLSQRSWLFRSFSPSLLFEYGTTPCKFRHIPSALKPNRFAARMDDSQNVTASY